jgi:AcrR family transcriptional regulator
MVSSVARKAENPRRRRRLSTDDRRQELYRATLELIGTTPWDEVSMADVALAAGVSKPLLYHYFPTKTDLYVATVAWAADQLRAATRPDQGLAPPDRLRQALAAHVDWIEANSAAYRAVLQGGMSSHPQVQKIVRDSRDDVVRRLTEGFGLGQPTAAQQLALRAWVGLLDTACLEWLASRDLPRDEVVTFLARSLTHGPLAARPGAERPSGT